MCSSATLKPCITVVMTQTRLSRNAKHAWKEKSALCQQMKKKMRSIRVNRSLRSSGEIEKGRSDTAVCAAALPFGTKIA